MAGGDYFSIDAILCEETVSSRTALQPCMQKPTGARGTFKRKSRLDLAVTRRLWTESCRVAIYQQRGAVHVDFRVTRALLPVSQNFTFSNF